jgi:probable rRNA maturation factor
VIAVDVYVSEEWDSSTDWEILAAAAVRTAVSASRHAGLTETPAVLEVSVKLTSDEEVRSLNAGWRGKDRATNVLSFPMIEADGLAVHDDAATGRGEALLGDIVLACGVCIREAGEKRVRTCAHAAHLIVHGTLHLLGYDHERSEAEAEEMEAVERQALAGLGIADPYTVHG